ncbi:MBL fold metallo-hydrolase [Jatrophihabitans endophyticus]|uniref:MBL fold metallo-hydrolase n=1 Tax=Jatrophihabitans endophyticus TaxID=1206085 RepID=UPI0019F1ED2E|nr:MBL fold metallo-hydrolase [Jatrophihabitans endophyticus]MBE7190427.1 MBL fold metallo-hydrolase [Jatrophihabitans endophyticus]
MQVEVISTEELGDRSYVVHDGSSALVIDPQRDIDRVEALIERLGVTVEIVCETHIHNDYVTGGYELARRAGARYLVNAEDEVSFDRVPVSDGSAQQAGRLTVTAVATPGHTYSHLSFVVTDSGEPHEPPAVFTGGSLLFGSVGRTDLLGTDKTDDLTHKQFHSAHRLAEMLPDDAPVFPTHGFGSFCSSGSAAGGDSSTIGTEKSRNDALTIENEDAFVDRLIANLTAYPAYHAHMAPLNLAGPDVPEFTEPHQVDPAELAKRVADGEWVVDLRDRVAYAADHLHGTVSIALGAQFATYLGWLAPWGEALTLIGESPEQITEAQRHLVRIGVDQLAGAATGTLESIGGEQAHGAYPRVDFADVARDAQAPGDVVLDVRRDDERAKGYIVDSTHIPLSDLVRRLDDLPDGRLWVHCASGFRASIGASLLERAGRDVIYIDDDYGNAEKAGLMTVES